MRDLIKKVLRESEEETAEEFIARFEKDKKRIEKTIPKIVNFLKSGFDDYNLLDISVGETKKAYGSTFYVGENGKYTQFTATVLTIRMSFIDLKDSQKRKVGNMIWDQLENIFGIDLSIYGTPLILKLINLEEKEF